MSLVQDDLKVGLAEAFRPLKAGSKNFKNLVAQSFDIVLGKFLAEFEV